MLDPKGREAARLWAIDAASDGGVPGDDYIDGILTAYLSTMTPAEVGGLVERLQERATVMEHLSPDFASVCREAATALAAKDAELAVQREAKEHARRLCDRAEAQLAEARKALEPFADAADDLEDDHKDTSSIWECPAAVNIDAGHLRAARRALTGGKEDG